VRGPLVDGREDPERLQPVDGPGRQVVARAALDLGLAELGADALGPRRQRRRLAGESVRVDGEVDLAYVIEPRPGGVTRTTPSRNDSVRTKRGSKGKGR
jgi:hypothetical protein